MRGWYDVVDKGAKGDGTTPDNWAIQASITEAEANGGGVVWLPPGTYRLTGPLVVKRQVKLLGAGWSSNNDPRSGTWLLVDQDGFVPITASGLGTVISGIAFDHVQPAPGPAWTPKNYPFAIHAETDDLLIEDIFLFRATRGIRVAPPGGGSVGRVVLDRIWGQPLREGIHFDYVRDVVKTNNVHFWPFWSINEPNGGHVRAFMWSEGTAIRSNWSDNPQFSNVFALGYSNGFAFGESEGNPTSKFMITNADFDNCRTAVRIDGTNTTGQICNLNAQSVSDSLSAITFNASGVIQLCNIRLKNFCHNLIRNQGGGHIHLANAWLHNWNFEMPPRFKFPAIEALNGSRIYFETPVYFEQDSSFASPRTGGDGTFLGKSSH